MNDRQRQLIAQIEAAFAGVELGDGVSVSETRVVDDYGTAQQRAAAREPDEKLDWHKAMDDPEFDLYFGSYSAMCFLDPVGMRFYLPACLLQVVRAQDVSTVGEAGLSLHFHLTHLSGYCLEQFSILDQHQRNCVHQVMLYWRALKTDDCDDDSIGPYDDGRYELDRAIRDYWSRPVGE